MVDRVSLPPAQNRALNTLRLLSDRQFKNRERLTTNSKLNDVTDGFTVFFQARSLIQRAEVTIERSRNAEQGLIALTTFVEGAESAQNFLRQLEGILSSARDASTIRRAEVTEDFNELGTQFFNLINDVQYQGNNLLSNTNDQLRFQVGDSTADNFQLQGRNLLGIVASAGAIFSFGIFSQASAVGLRSTPFALSRFTFTAAGVPTTISSFEIIGDDNSNLGLVDDLRAYIRTARSRLETTEAILALHVSLLRQRLDFNQDYIDTHNQGSDKLRLADLNEEAAIFLALRSRYDSNVSTLRISDENQNLFLQLL